MERTFDFITDTCCGMPQEYIEAHGVTVLPLGYTIAGETYGGIEGKQLPPKEFYRLLREGNVCHTFQVTAEQAKPSVEASFKAGRDVVIVTFSSALSGTASSFTIAANELMEKYPSRKAFIVDSLGGSLGEGMLLEYLVKKADAGTSIEEVYAYGDWLRHRIAYLFTVDDLDCLRRGGRISGAVAVVGKLLKIKPLLHANPKGLLMPIAKIVGRKRSLEALADEAAKRSDLSPEDPIYISHGDCEEDAVKLAALMKERLGEHPTMINFVDPVMGAHGGPGVLAVFLKCKVRE